MAGEESGALRRVEQAAGSRGDLRLGATHVCDQVFGAEDGGKLFHPVERGVDGNGQQDHLAFARGLKSVSDNGVDCAHGECGLGAFDAAIPAGNRTAEAGSAQRQAGGCT